MKFLKDRRQNPVIMIVALVKRLRGLRCSVQEYTQWCRWTNRFIRRELRGIPHGYYYEMRCFSKDKGQVVPMHSFSSDYKTHGPSTDHPGFQLYMDHIRKIMMIGAIMYFLPTRI